MHFSIYSLVILFLISGIAILPRKISVVAKTLLTLAVAAIVFKLRIYALFSGSWLIPPAIPGWCCLALAGLFFAMLFFALCLIVAGSYRLIRKLRGGAWCTPCDKWVDLALLGVSLVVATWGLFNGAREPDVKTYTVTIPDLPPQAKGFKIAVLTDIHADPRCSEADLRRIIERTNALRPDVIALLGDNMDGYLHGDDGALAKKLAHFQDLRAKYGVFGVAGNHEYYSGYREWNGFLLDHGVLMLENAHVDLPCHLSIAGVTDSKAEDLNEVVPSPEKAISGAKYPAILLCHQPKNAQMSADCGYFLQLSGHTHGGLFPILKKYVADHNKGFVSGWYDVDDMKLYVSDGTGMWGGLPIRFGSRAEITLITLQ